MPDWGGSEKLMKVSEMGSGLAHTLPLQLQLPKLQHGPGIGHMTQQAYGGWVIASAGR